MVTGEYVGTASFPGTESSAVGNPYRTTLEGYMQVEVSSPVALILAVPLYPLSHIGMTQIWGEVLAFIMFV